MDLTKIQDGVPLLKTSKRFYYGNPGFVIGDTRFVGLQWVLRRADEHREPKNLAAFAAIAALEKAALAQLAAWKALEAAEAAKEAAIEEQAREEDAVAGECHRSIKPVSCFFGFSLHPPFPPTRSRWRVTIQSDRDIRPRCEENIWIRHGDMLC